MTGTNGTNGTNGTGPTATRRGRQALFTAASETHETDVVRPAKPDDSALAGRRALFSSTEPVGLPPEQPARGGDGQAVPSRSSAVVHCRTCLAATPVSLPSLGVSLVPSLWLPTRPWPRLMRCPACHHMSWCRIEWPKLR